MQSPGFVLTSLGWGGWQWGHPGAGVSVWSQGLSSPLLHPPQSPAARLGLGSARRDLPAWGRLMSAGAFCLLGAGLCIAGSRIVHCWEQGCALLGAGQSKAGAAELCAPTARFHLGLCVSLKVGMLRASCSCGCPVSCATCPLRVFFI